MNAKIIIDALAIIRNVPAATIRAYAAEEEYFLRQDGYERANDYTRARFEDEAEWEDACQAAGEVQDAAHYAAAPLRWIACYSIDAVASDLWRALVEGWKRAATYWGAPDVGEFALAEARRIAACAEGGAA